MKKLTKEEREKRIRDILNDVRGNMCNYQDFVLDCVESVVSKWDDKDILEWSGEGEYDDE